MTLSKDADKARKRLARAKAREEREAEAAEQAAIAALRQGTDEKWRDDRDRHSRELIAKLEYDADPQRNVERVDRAIQWLADCQKSPGAQSLVNISVAIRATLGEGGRACDEFSWGSALQLPSWNGVGWLNPADIRKVLLSDLKRRGLLEQFELLEQVSGWKN